ncbi:MAG: DUF885 family protein, partial [Cellulomonadaceae bacterium]
MPHEPAPRTATPIDDLAEWWVDELCRLVPETDVELGRPEHTGRYADRSPGGVAQLAAAARTALDALGRLAPQDAVDTATHADLTRDLSLTLAQIDQGVHLTDVNVVASPAQAIRDVLDLMPTDTEDDWVDVAARVGHVPEAVDGYIATLREGARQGRTVAQRQLEATAAQLESNTGPEGFFARFADSATGVPDTVREDLRGAARAAS